MAVRAEIRAAQRFWDFQRHLAGQRGGLDRRQSALRQDVSGRSAWTWAAIAAATGRLHGNRAGSAEQRGGRNRCRESDFHFGISPGPALVRISTGKSRNLSSAGRDHSRAGWQTPRALLHGVESGNRASIRNDAPACKRNTWARGP